MAIDREILKKYFPNLSKEIEENAYFLSLTYYPSLYSKNRRIPKFRNYEPNVIDFIRRCDSESQALEIVDFLEKRNELSHEEAEKIRILLKEKGVRFFGSKKNPGWYFKEDHDFFK